MERGGDEGVVEVPNHTTARKKSSSILIQYSLYLCVFFFSTFRKSGGVNKISDTKSFGSESSRSTITFKFKMSYSSRQSILSCLSFFIVTKEYVNSKIMK